MKPRNILKIRSFNKLPTKVKRLQADFAVKQAEKIMKSGDWNKAAKKWESLIKKADDYAPSGAYVRLSICYRHLKKYKLAQKIIDIGMKKYPDYYPISHENAEIATAKQDWQDAALRWNNQLDRLEDYTKLDMLSRVNRGRQAASIQKRLDDLASYKREIVGYRKSRPNPKIAVFTAIVGNYDFLRLPEILDPNIDYIVFTDQPLNDTGIFQIRPLPYFHIDSTRAARFIKTHAHVLLDGYDIAIWLDANIMITGDISPLIKDFVRSKKAVGALSHPLRRSLYLEAEACIEKGKEDKAAINEQMDHYKKIGFDSNGLIESNFMMFDLKNKKTAEFLAAWWQQIDRFTKRDQLSINYALKHSKTAWHLLMPRPKTVRSHPSFVITSHHADRELMENLLSKINPKKLDPFVASSPRSNRDGIIKKWKGTNINAVVCVHNALEDVRLCIDSIERTRKNPGLKLIIVDDGSDKPTADYLQTFSATRDWVKLIRNEKATGYTKAANLGVKNSSGKLVILLNSDTIVTKGWSEKMAEAVFSKPHIGLVGPLSSAASHQSIPQHLSSKTQTATNELPSGITVENMNELCESSSPADIYPLVPLVHGVCFGITREAIEKVGPFDEKNFPRGYGEENDYCFRAANAGLCLVLATNTYIFHAKSKSYMDKTRLELQKQGSAKLKELHGVERIKRAILSMQSNPTLVKLRADAQKFYDSHLK